MSEHDMIGLRAKVRVANSYLEQVLKYRGKFDMYDVLKVVTPNMRGLVEIVGLDQAQTDGLGIVRIREGVA